MSVWVRSVLGSLSRPTKVVRSVSGECYLKWRSARRSQESSLELD